MDWRFVWREGIAPHLPTEGLQRLLLALECNNPEVIQGEFILTYPEQDPCGPIEGCGPVVYAFWLAGQAPTVDAGELKSFRVFQRCRDALLYAQGWQIFWDWWREGKREEVFIELAEEVKRELSQRLEAA